MLLEIALLVLVSNIISAIGDNQDTLFLENDDCSVRFSTENGAIVALTQKGQVESILSSGEEGLWSVGFVDGSEISAAVFSSSSTERNFQYSPDPLQMTYQSPEIKVVINVCPKADCIEFIGEVTPLDKIVLSFAFPGRLRFKSDSLDRFICPMDGNQSVGTAFKSTFFQRQNREEPTAWEHQLVGPRGYRSIFGGNIEIREDETRATLKVTPEGREWLGSELADRLEGAKALVNRPSPREHANLVLVDSEHGSYFAGGNLDGYGYLWRVGGRVDNPDVQNVKDIVIAVIKKLISSSSKEIPKIGLLALKQGPQRGGWTNIRVDEWIKAFQSLSGANVEMLISPKAMMDGLKSQKFLAILNPYGEWLPANDVDDMETGLDAISQYVKAGGQWFEVGGYTFYCALQPIRYFSYKVPYPAAFADFFHLDTQMGSASIYRAQPREHAPWEGAENPDAIFIPGRLSIGGDERGGYCDRIFGICVPVGKGWRAPAVRIRVGKSAAENLGAYCEANGINRRLKDKMSPELLEKFRNSVLVYYAGNCKEKLENIELLPVPSQVHFADYLKGGLIRNIQITCRLIPNLARLRNFASFSINVTNWGI